MNLSDFEVITFDCYGTLIDWESGILQALEPWVSSQGKNFSEAEILESFANHEAKQEKKFPQMLYTEILYQVHKSLAQHWNIISTDADAKEFSQSICNWRAFPDSAEALQALKQNYKLVILSNVDHVSFRESNKKLNVEFDYVFTAQDIGSYKPNPNNFIYMLEKLAAAGIEKNKILHTAQSLYHDHVPAQQFGLATCWIDRRHSLGGWGATVPPQQEVKPNFRFTTLAEMAIASAKF